MLASNGMRTFVLLAAVAALSACSEHKSQYEPSVDTLPTYTARDAQTSPAVGMAIADLIGHLGQPRRAAS